MIDRLTNADLPHSHTTYLSPLAAANSMVRQLDKAPCILRMRQVIERTNLSRATLYALAQSDPTFPRKIKLTARTVGYLEQEVEEWIMSRVQARGIAA